jgi:hypothetical protein
MSLEAIFYSEPVPSSLQTLTLLALVFDRVHFPGVHIPLEGVDEAAVLAEAERIRALPTGRPSGYQLINCLIYAANGKHLRDFCEFAPEVGLSDYLEPGAKEMVDELEEAIFGPRPVGHFAAHNLAFVKSLPGSADLAISGPPGLTYPANALLTSLRTGQLLVNDNPRIPIPGLPTTGYKSHAKVLATILALEAVHLVLPTIRPLSFEEIAEFRSETSTLVRPFRSGMLRLSKELNDAIQSDATLDDVQHHAAFLVETTVGPELIELRDQISKPSRPWYRRIVDLASEAPELVGSFATMPKGLALAKVLATLANTLADVRDAQLEKEGIIKRGAFHYLLKVEKLGP